MKVMVDRQSLGFVLKAKKFLESKKIIFPVTCFTAGVGFFSATGNQANEEKTTVGWTFRGGWSHGNKSLGSESR